MKNKSYVIGSTLVAALGGLLFGFDTAVISGTTQSLETVFHLSEFWLGFTVATALIGTVLGSLIVGKPGDSFGRKKVLIILAVFYSISAFGSAFANNWIMFMIYRFIGGIAVGGSSVMAPMYIAEISPARMRGRLVALSQFNIVTGILLAFFSNYLIASLIESQAWRWMFGIEALPALVFFGLLFLIPNSPRWLVKQGRTEEAREVLSKVESDRVDEELAEIAESLKTEKEATCEPLMQAKYRKPILFAVLLAMFNQLSGINVIMYYAPRIFEATGLSSNVALLQSVSIGVTNLVFTVLAMFFIDRFGRRTLLLIGSVGMFISLAGAALRFFMNDFSGAGILIYIVGFIAFFAFSQGAVIWVFIAEIFPNRIRAKGQALGSFTHWIMNAVIAWTFPLVLVRTGGGSAFMFFSVMMVLHFFFVLKWLPETKGRSLEQIQRDLGIE